MGFNNFYPKNDVHIVGGHLLAVYCRSITLLKGGSNPN